METAKKYGISTAIVGITLMSCVMMVVVACTRTYTPPDTTDFKQIEIIESGTINGEYYQMFKDPVSKVRIFFYHGAMQMLPPEKKDQAEATK